MPDKMSVFVSIWSALMDAYSIAEQIQCIFLISFFSYPLQSNKNTGALIQYFLSFPLPVSSVFDAAVIYSAEDDKSSILHRVLLQVRTRSFRTAQS